MGEQRKRPGEGGCGGTARWGSWQGTVAAHPAATRQGRKVTAEDSWQGCSSPGSAGRWQQGTAGSQEQFLAPRFFRKRSRPDGQSAEEEQVQLAARTELQKFLKHYFSFAFEILWTKTAYTYSVSKQPVPHKYLPFTLFMFHTWCHLLFCCFLQAAIKPVTHTSPTQLLPTFTIPEGFTSDKITSALKLGKQNFLRNTYSSFFRFCIRWKEYCCLLSSRKMVPPLEKLTDNIMHYKALRNST